MENQLEDNFMIVLTSRRFVGELERTYLRYERSRNGFKSIP